MLVYERCPLDNNKEGIVIDPYSGSGTTCLAAKLLGKNYLGIDISEEYTNLAIARLHNFKKYESMV